MCTHVHVHVHVGEKVKEQADEGDIRDISQLLPRTFGVPRVQSLF